MTKQQAMPGWSTEYMKNNYSARADYVDLQAALARLRVAVEVIETIVADGETWMQSPLGQNVLARSDADRERCEAMLAGWKAALREIGEVPK